MHGSIIGYTGHEILDGEGMAAGGIGDRPEAILPKVELVEGIIACGKPVEGSGGIGYAINRKAFGSGANNAVGCELHGNPVAKAKTVGTTALPQRHLIGCSRLKSRKCIAVVCNHYKPCSPCAGISQLVFIAVTAPYNRSRFVICHYRIHHWYGT